jgi:hypothetical protein
MRAVRWFTVLTVVAVLLAMPGGAGADGGSYIELNRTHYLPGETAVGLAYVFVPESKQDLFERGPFYAFVVPRGATIREDRPIPDGVIRVGTFSIEHERGKSFELRVSFTVPDLTGAFYTIAFCNDPCTISGFREPLTGSSRSSRRCGRGNCSRSSHASTPASSVCVANSGGPSVPARSFRWSSTRAKRSVSACRRS